jgi:hypothetical protein
MGILESFKQLFTMVSFLFSSGGWLLFVAAAIYSLGVLWVLWRQDQYIATIKWVMLSIDIPKENEQTFLAMEQIFAQMHAIHTTKTFGERYFGGEVLLWVVFEIVSFGGKLKYLLRVPERFRNLAESAIYAQYPQAEVKEVEDYMTNVPAYDSERSYYDVFGTEFKLKKEDAWPIRTYKYFEHQASQIIVDPLAAVLEALSSVEPHELMAVQYLFQPTDDAWKVRGEKLVKELKGEKKEKAKAGPLSGFGEAFTDIPNRVVHGIADIALNVGAYSEAKLSPKMQEYEPPSMMMHLSPGQKDAIAAVENNLSKIGYQTKLRVLYLAPKEKFRGDMKFSLVGGFRQFDDTSLNGLKPDTKITWTTMTYKLSQKLEKPYITWQVNKRKRKLVRNFKNRLFSKGLKPFVLNIEEMATIFHLPILTVKAPQQPLTEIRKSEAPMNLPIQL